MQTTPFLRVGVAENIGQAYRDADDNLKKMYLGLFFEKFLVTEGKVVEAHPSNLLRPLLGSKVRVRNTWGPCLVDVRTCVFEEKLVVPVLVG